MKAIINTNPYIELRDKSKNLLLTIGMIVKNEEKNLERCLNSVLPLLNDTSVELVIVDTGSTDKTIEISKKYTNKIYNFKWINDFSAARNFGLEHSHGQWLLYIDADQAFDENVLDILEFLKSPEAELYNRVTFRTKNYSDKSFISYEEHPEPRLVRLLEGSKFQGVIHEFIPMVEPIKDLNVVLHHYGYVSGIIDDKIERNLKPLMESYEKNPNDPTVLMYLHFSHRFYKDKKYYFDKWAEIMEKDSDKDGYDYRIYITAGFHFFAEIQDYENTIKYGMKIYSLSNFDDLSVSLTVFAELGDVYLRKKDYTNAIKYYKKYVDKYPKYLNGELISDNASSFLEHVQSYDFQRKICQLAESYLANDEPEKALEAMKDLDLSELLPDDINTALTFYGKLIGKSISNDFNAENLKFFFTELESNYNDKILIFVSNVLLASKSRIVSATILKPYFKDSYVKIMLEILSNDQQQIRELQANAFIQEISEYSIGYAPLLWEVLKCSGSGLANTISKLSITDINLLVSNLRDFNQDYAEVSIKFCNEYEVSTLKELRFEIELMKKISSENDDACYLYACLLANYVSNVYNTEILNDDDITVLPFEDQLGYYMYKADGALSIEKKVEYIHYLRKALKVCPNMKYVIKKLSEDVMQ